MLMRTPGYPRPRSGPERFRRYAAIILGGIIALYFVIFAALSAGAAGPLIVAVDGDTIHVDDERIRIVGLDAPETYQARCDSERQRGHAATAYLRRLLASGTVTVRRQGRDRYGRTLARVYIDGRDVAAIMIRAGHAVPYDCPRGRCPRRIDWCGGRS
ncbi:Staphylococcal nuclease homologue [Chelatococcus sambhunathii]|uniref:Staphylococcal nuclease homologue n=1 Tax=Chelatococcus sambhunathii TaxID=363953 RepID=A0ABM9U8E2_9HYPH|nr:thermonuclease family protein [Chelatococcus sambhunathii]CUA90155.1 Staphylococcal nuclease homologue [Chelatococcus sambhunathii]